MKQTLEATNRARLGADWNASQKILLVQGALAAVLYALGTGNFLAGYLQLMGATPAQTALIAMFPQLGCVLQLFAPLYFERLRYRKRSIVTLCFVFRVSVGFMVFAPLLFPENSGLRMAFICALYFFSFLAAGFVTPALNQWMMQIAPEKNRGQYFSVKDIISVVVNALVAFLMGWQLDWFTARGNPMAGFAVIYGFSILASFVDMALMRRLDEPPSTPMPSIRLAALLEPIKDRHFRPLLVHEVLTCCAGMLSGGFLSVYQLTVLGMSHTFITSVGVACSLIGMGASWMWGKIADKTYWTQVILAAYAISMACSFGWWLLPRQYALALGPVLMGLTAVSNGAGSMAAVNLQFDHCPAVGKTTYLGVSAAISNVSGYGAAVVGSWLQPMLEPALGPERSIAAMFGISGFLMLCTLWYGLRRLPKKAQE